MRGNATSIRLFFFILGLLVFGQAQAQQARYIYIQSENNQPYYVRLNGNTYGSSASGYLLIPQLASGDYTVQLGFPRSTTEYSFSFPIGQDDRGFSLKLGVDNSWSLFDMVSFNVIKGTLFIEKRKEEAKTSPATEVKEVVPEVKKVADKPVVTETAVAAAAPASQKKPAVASLIRKIYEKAGSDGVDLVYVVPNGNKADTVILFVPHLSK